MTSRPEALRLAVVQTAPVLRDPAHNARAIAELASSAAADIALTPELSLTGYDVGDAVHDLARPIRAGNTFAEPVLRDIPGLLVAGCIEAAPRGPFNTAAVLHAGRVHFRHRKIYLPTYGMFDEGRWFGRGTSLDVWETATGWRIGILICEDFWHPGLTYALASRGIDLLLVQAAAPGRGAWEGGAAGRFASADVWERIARTTAQLYGIHVALCNRTGVEGGVTFAGGSLVAGPDGALLARAGDRDEEVLTVEVSRAALRAAHRPYSHARDDDPGLVMRELARGLAEGT
jgi:predicted amidohydrolase